MQLLGARDQHVFAFWIVRVRDAAVDRTRFRARFVIEEPDALRALVANDVEDVSRDRRMLDSVQLPFDPTRVDGGVRALGLARAAVDAFVRDDGCHSLTSASFVDRSPYQPRLTTAIHQQCYSYAISTSPLRRRWAMTICCTSLEPSYTRATRTSRQMRSIMYSART